MAVFYDRRDAGRQLGTALRDRFGVEGDAVVLGLARGGVVVAAEVSRLLHLPLEAVVVSKVGAPGDPEVAIGAVGEGGRAVINDAAVRTYRVRAPFLWERVDAARTAVRRRAAAYRRAGPPDLRGKTAMLVDDGIATGESMEAAIHTVRRWQAGRVVVAAPVAAPEAVTRLREAAEDVVVLDVPLLFVAVSQAYVSFPQVGDEEVLALLDAPACAPALVNA